ncbi:hypothetical protein BDZ91DRAFT_765241 [Kalaharituber pfeilii]|nr:hypothetical protein BDZ91DRAFT_765241 [Kalaharituber pfeilii]
MAQLPIGDRFPQRDRDLMDADDYLSESKLDSLWEWFCAANEEKLDPQMIFVKLVNAARKPYRGNVLSHGFPSSGSSHYTPSEYTVLEALGETPQQSHESHKVQALQTKLAIAETLLQAKEAKIQDLQEGFLHIKQKQQQHKQNVEAEKQQLEMDLAALRAEYVLTHLEFVP